MIHQKVKKFFFLTNLFHGSPFNAVVSLMRDHEFHHITGINIPLAVEVMNGKICRQEC